MRHADATEVGVDVEVGGDHLTLHVTDDGRGIDAGATTTGHGLANLAERAERLGGTFTIGAGRGGGTALRWSVPLAGTT